MCDKLQRARARFVSLMVSRNADALYGLADHIEERILGYCEEHRPSAENLSTRCKMVADRMVREYIED